MKISYILLGLVLVFGCSKKEKSSETETRDLTWLDKEFDMNQIVSKKDSFNMVSEGNVVGYWIWEVISNENNITVKDYTEMTGVVEENLTFEVDRSSLFTKSLYMKLSSGGSTMSVDINRENNKQLSASYEITGEVNRAKTIDTLYNVPVINRPTFFGLIPGLPLTEGLKIENEVFFTSTSLITKVDLEVVGSEKVFVPAGTFECFKIRFVGGNPANVIYVSKSSPRKIVKVEVIDQPLVMELVSSENF